MQSTNDQKQQAWRAWVVDQGERGIELRIEHIRENTPARGPYPLSHTFRSRDARLKLLDHDEHIVHFSDFAPDGVPRPIRVRIMLDGADTLKEIQLVPKAGSLERWDVVELASEFMPEVRGFVALVEPIHRRWSLPQIPNVNLRKLRVRALIKDNTNKRWSLWCERP